MEAVGFDFLPFFYGEQSHAAHAWQLPAASAGAVLAVCENWKLMENGKWRMEVLRSPNNELPVAGATESFLFING